jgi:hypothetical protein
MSFSRFFNTPKRTIQFGLFGATAATMVVALFYGCGWGFLNLLLGKCTWKRENYENFNCTLTSVMGCKGDTYNCTSTGLTAFDSGANAAMDASWANYRETLGEAATIAAVSGCAVGIAVALVSEAICYSRRGVANVDAYVEIADAQNNQARP